MISMDQLKNYLTRGASESMTGALTALLMFGAVAIYNETEANKLREQAEMVAAENEARKKLKPDVQAYITQFANEKCGIMTGEKIPFKWNLLTRKEGERFLRIEGFKAMLSCAEFLEKNTAFTDDKLKEFVINYGNLCVQIKEGFDENSKGFHPFLLPFYRSLQGKLCEPAVLQKLDEIRKSEAMIGFDAQVENLKELIGKLNNLDTAQKDFPILKPKPKDRLGVFCVRALDTVIKDNKDLQSLINFVLTHQEKIMTEDTKFPQLRTLLTNSKVSADKKGKTLESHLTIDPALIKALLSSICTSDTGLNKIQEKEDLIFPIFKEVAELLAGDNSKQAKEIESLFLKVFNKIKDY